MHNLSTMRPSHPSGQILVLVLLVVLIGMSIGLSIASRTLSNLKDTSKLTQSNRAFNAAEAGIEHALTKLNTDPDYCKDHNCGDEITLEGVDSLKVTTDTIGESTNAFGIENVNRDDVVQVNLEGYTGSTIKLYWGNSADNCTAVGTNMAAATVVSIIYVHSGTYGMSKLALDECAAAHNNNFDAAAVEIPSPGSVTIQDGSVVNNYAYMANINVASGGGNVPSGASVLLARVRLMYGDSTEQVAIAPVGTSVNLPNQGQQITSTAVSGTTQRTVKVVRSNTSLPAIFDYALFNGSTQTLSK